MGDIETTRVRVLVEQISLARTARRPRAAAMAATRLVVMASLLCEAHAFAVRCDRVARNPRSNQRAALFHLQIRNHQKALGDNIK